jgi:hypothetical protein
MRHFDASVSPVQRDVCRTIRWVFCNWTPLISLLNNPFILRRSRTSYWIAWEECFQLLCISGFSVILKEAKTFNQNEPPVCSAAAKLKYRVLYFRSGTDGVRSKRCGLVQYKNVRFSLLTGRYFSLLTLHAASRWRFCNSRYVTLSGTACSPPCIIAISFTLCVPLTEFLSFGTGKSYKALRRARWVVEHRHVVFDYEILNRQSWEGWCIVLMVKVELSASIVCPFSTDVPSHRQS